MSYSKYLTIMMISCLGTWVNAQPYGEANEPSPEDLDAAFTVEDAAREAAAWSSEIIERPTLDPIARMTEGADLVVRCSVASQLTTYGIDDFPFTHTTLNISEVLKGNYPADQITVIQEGGPSINEPDKVIIVSDVRYFGVGDEELLFLQLDPDNPHASQRIRVTKRFGILNGKVYGENGRGLIYTSTEDAPGYRLGWSRNRNPHPRFRDFQIGEHEFSKQFRPDIEDFDYGGTDAHQQSGRGRPGYESSVDVGVLNAAITSLVGDRP